jgi:hypothetical protein
MTGSWTGSASSREALRLLAAVAVVHAGLSALSPRLARVLLWPIGLRGRRLLLYVIVGTLLRTALRHWVLPWAAREMERNAAVVEELRVALGRDPTEDEVHERRVRDAEMRD